MEEIVKIERFGKGVGRGHDGVLYIFDIDGQGSVMSEKTGELYIISARDSKTEEPVEIRLA